jgi:hypothetical protein
LILDFRVIRVCRSDRASTLVREVQPDRMMHAASQTGFRHASRLEESSPQEFETKGYSADNEPVMSLLVARMP